MSLANMCQEKFNQSFSLSLSDIPLLIISRDNHMLQYYISSTLIYIQYKDIQTVFSPGCKFSLMATSYTPHADLLINTCSST